MRINTHVKAGLLIALSIPGVAAGQLSECLKRNDGTLTYIECLQNYLGKLDSNLESEQKRLIQCIQDNHGIGPAPAIIDAFRRAQTTWREWRDAQCTYDNLGSGGAPIWETAHAEECKIERSEERLREFRSTCQKAVPSKSTKKD